MATRPPGRPLIYDTQASGRICLAVTPAQLVDLRAIAAENGLSLSSVIREAVLEYVAAYDERPSGPPRR